MLINEGGALAAALPGAMTLALDICCQEEELGLSLDAVWVDAGSGLTAQALICGLGYLQHQAEVHVVLMAGSELSFGSGLELVQSWCADLWGTGPAQLPRYTLHRPTSARSYGATNAAVWGEIRGRALDSGLILDPLYTAKLSAAFTSLQSEGQESRTQLLVHSGGGLNLFGFTQAWPGLDQNQTFAGREETKS